MAIVANFHEGFETGEQVWYYNDTSIVANGKILRIDIVNENVVMCVSTKYGYCFVPFCDVFKDRKLCEEYAKTEYVFSEEHEALSREALAQGILNPMDDDNIIDRIRDFMCRKRYYDAVSTSHFL